MAGFGIAALGCGAALGILAPSANAASVQARSANYDSNATATAGNVTVPDIQDSLISVTASARPGSGTAPRQAGLSTGRVASTLKLAPGLGPVLASALRAANPGNAALASVSATATHGGDSAACASVFSADCTAAGQDRPLVLRLGLSDLTAAAGAAASRNDNVLPGVSVPSLPNANDYSIVLSVHGPRAACSAGPAGTGRLSASASLASATVDLQDDGKSVLPRGPVPLANGNVVGTVLGLQASSPLQKLLSAVNAAVPLTVTFGPGSHGTSPKGTATATAGHVRVGSSTGSLLDFKPATVSCGANTRDGGTYGPSGPESEPVSADIGGSVPDSVADEVPALHNLTSGTGPLGPSVVPLPTLYAPLP